MHTVRYRDPARSETPPGQNENAGAVDAHRERQAGYFAAGALRGSERKIKLTPDKVFFSISCNNNHHRLSSLNPSIFKKRQVSAKDMHGQATIISIY
jgi:hypothetical protein